MRTRPVLVTFAFSLTSALGTTPALADREGESERGCAGAEETCESREASPSFEDSPVNESFNFGPVCVFEGSCTWESEPESDPAEGEAVG